MPAFVTNTSNRWDGHVPYAFAEENERNKWIESKIQEFNKKFTNPIFKPRSNDSDSDYVEIGTGSNSPIGKQKEGGKQDLNCSTR